MRSPLSLSSTGPINKLTIPLFYDRSILCVVVVEV